MEYEWNTVAKRSNVIANLRYSDAKSHFSNGQVCYYPRPTRAIWRLGVGGWRRWERVDFVPLTAAQR
jgi:hypothetical protein